jgi:hypothetical protein
MSVLYVRIEPDWDCHECRDALLQDCIERRLPLPSSEFALVPEHWISRTCPHGKQGFTMVALRSDSGTGSPDHDSVDPRDDVPSAEIEDQPHRQKTRWRDLWPDTIDATKGIGYPARDIGRYGSHPSHDGSDDD